MFQQEASFLIAQVLLHSSTQSTLFAEMLSNHAIFGKWSTNRLCCAAYRALGRELLANHPLCVESARLLSLGGLRCALSCAADRTVFLELLANSSFLVERPANLLGCTSNGSIG